MVFAPTRDFSIEPHDPAVAPKRLDHVAPPTNPPDSAKRLPWRAVVHWRDRETLITAWHMVGCATPSEEAAHCPEGQQLMDKVGDPDGHCLVNGACVRCSAKS